MSYKSSESYEPRDTVQHSNTLPAKTSLKDKLTGRRGHHKFHPVRRYGLHGDNRLHYGNIPFRHKYDRAPFLALLIEDYTLRMNMQEQERIKRRINSLRPPMESDNQQNDEWPAGFDEAHDGCSDLSPLLHDRSFSSRNSELDNTQTLTIRNGLHQQVTKSDDRGITVLQHKLDEVKYQHIQLSRKLYEVETMLPEAMKEIYDSIRQDPRWYMREVLVKDCADRGGCCSRDCGCCALRATSSYEKGMGHCTVECFCCVGFRGVRPTAEEKKDTLKGMTMLLRCDVPTHFVRMVNAFFSKA